MTWTGQETAGRSAVERLQEMKAHQWTLFADIARNPLGYLVSGVLHAVLLLVFGLIAWEIVADKPVTYIPVTLAENLPLTSEELDDLLEYSPVTYEKDQVPNVPADHKDEKVGYWDTPDEGAPNWQGGGNLAGDGDAGGNGDGPGGWPGWGGRLKDLRKGLDVVFVFDSTGSMGGVILEVKTRIRELMAVLTYLVPNARVGIVTYRDLKKYDIDDYEYTVKYTPLRKGDREGLDKLQGFLNEVEAYGGSDIPEAIYEGLKAAIDRADWQQGTHKVIIIFGDAPPRPEDNGLHRVYTLAKEWHEKTGGIVSCIDTNGGSRILGEFKELARQGGGEACFINADENIIGQLLISTFGSEWGKPVIGALNDYHKSKKDEIIGR